MRPSHRFPCLSGASPTRVYPDPTTPTPPLVVDIGARVAGQLEWLVSRRYLSEASMAELSSTDPIPTTGKELQVA
jgi:hypothetical protein